MSTLFWIIILVWVAFGLPGAIAQYNASLTAGSSKAAAIAAAFSVGVTGPIGSLYHWIQSLRGQQ